MLEPGQARRGDPTGGERAGLTGELRRRARWGMVILGARSGVQQLVVLVGTLALARLLSPADFGVFAIVQFVLRMFRTFGDAGLGPSLIQSEESPDQRALSTVFWAQLGLTGAVLAGVWLLADALVGLWPDLPPEAPDLLRALSVSLLLTGLRVVPAILLERELRFGPLSVVDVGGTVSFYGTAVALAAGGAGAGALVTAVLAQGVVALLAIYGLRPWRPSLALDPGILGRLLRFGLPFQGKAIVGVLNGAVTPALAGGVLGKTMLGLNNFAQSTAWFPLQLVTIISRVSFPLFSRLAHDRDALAAELAFSLRLCGTVAAGFSTLFFALGPEIVAIIYHPKWLPAMGSLYVFSLALLVGYISPIVGAVFDGLGRPGVIFRLAVGWTLLNWLVVGSVLAFEPSLIAFAVAFSVHVVVGNLAVIALVERELPSLSLTRILLPLVLVGAGVAGFGRWILAPGVEGPVTLGGAMVAVIGLYLGLSVLVDPRLRADGLRLVERIRARRRERKRRGLVEGAATDE